MVIFSDFQCPYCRRYAAVTDSLHAMFPRLRIVERHYPITAIHPHAFRAALASECAARTDAYWRMRKAMFARQDLVETEAWGKLASSAGITDTLAIVHCVENRTTEPRVVADTVAGSRVRIVATPTVIVDGVVFGMPPTVDSLSRVLVRRRR